MRPMVLLLQVNKTKGLNLDSLNSILFSSNLRVNYLGVFFNSTVPQE